MDNSRRAWRWSLAGFVVGGLVGATILTVNVVGASGPDVPENASPGEILHTPPLLVPAGEPVDINFDAVCPQGDEPGADCERSGSLFVRADGETSFAELPLEEDDGMLGAVVPAPYSGGTGFDYYARLDVDGTALTLPEGAAEAPQHAWTLRDWTTVDLGDEDFGSTRAPDSVALDLGWGNGPGSVGLDSGPEQARIGPSAFDVLPDGSLVVLDQVNRRLLVGRSDGTRELPVEFEGGEGDLAVGSDGTVYVLDVTASPVVRSYAADGDPVAITALAAKSADMLRAGPGGPLVHAYPSEMWLPTGAGRPPLSMDAQLTAARPERAVGSAGVVVSASPAAARFALVSGARVLDAWVVRSATGLGEVQLAEPYRDGLLVVVRVWDEKRAEFRVLRLTPTGLAESFAVERAEWAESASLSRFRLHGNVLYQLRSTQEGAQIATFEIGGTP
jgi:hypothetical protein